MKFSFGSCFTVVFLTMILSCRKDEIIAIEPPEPVYELPNGLYAGTFTVYYPWDTISNPHQVELYDGSYYHESGPDHGALIGSCPFGGSGDFTITDDTLIFHGGSYLPAIYDWNLLIGGTYIYTWDGINLYFYKQIGDYVYEYDLYLQ